jgi:acyl-CoA reductase-like NAD-dependent aldehyde dehydrogenase
MRIFDEAMRINGERRRRSSVIEVFDPFSARCIGTVPRAEIRDVREAIDAAAAYRPRLSRYQRSEILGQAAAEVVARTREIAELITLESGLSLQDSLDPAPRSSMTARSSLATSRHTAGSDGSTRSAVRFLV